jgi:hypothetical protein
MKHYRRKPHRSKKRHLIEEIQVPPQKLVTLKFGPYRRGTPAPELEIHVHGESPPTAVAYFRAPVDSLHGDTYQVVYCFCNYGNVTARVEVCLDSWPPAPSRRSRVAHG